MQFLGRWGRSKIWRQELWDSQLQTPEQSRDVHGALAGVMGLTPAFDSFLAAWLQPHQEKCWRAPCGGHRPGMAGEVAGVKAPGEPRLAHRHPHTEARRVERARAPLADGGTGGCHPRLTPGGAILRSKLQEAPPPRTSVTWGLSGGPAPSCKSQYVPTPSTIPGSRSCWGRSPPGADPLPPCSPPG